MTTDLGPYRLEQPLGRGAMGAVWAAVHVPTGRPAAVKVLHEGSARLPEYRALFLKEVHASAALDHAQIVRVFDVGLVSAAASRANPALVEGSPWLAMERVAGQSLHSYRGRLAWDRLRPVLAGLLSALAHAHARGVIHRDLKPSNVLLDPDGRPHLLDFGIAHWVAPDGAQDVVASGTPAFMAPEQVDPSGRDLGPWTDLFAFGALTWTMVTGRPPFRSNRVSGAIGERLKPLPPLRPVVAVPEGLEAWLRLLLQPRPTSRFQRAADAVAALASLGGAEGSGRLPPPIDSDAPTRLLPATAPGPASAPTAPTVLLQEERLSSPVGPSLAAPAAPGLPIQPSEPARRPSLPGTGLGLWGLRDPPFVGRAEERRRLWDALRDVEAGAVRVVLLAGPVGCGKSRLVRWLCEGAHENGAHVSRAIHGPMPATSHGIGAMVARDLGCVGLEGAQLERRLLSLVRDPNAARARAALLQPTGSGERYAALVDHLATISVGRPAVVWIDDLPDGTDAQGALLHLLSCRTRTDLRTLVVATADDPPSDFVEEWVRAGAERMDLGPLDEEHHAELVGNLVGLGGRLAADLATRTGGNPLFAVQLISDWVARRLLVPTNHGYELPPGVHPEVPSGLLEVWRQRLDEGLAGRPDADGWALERAAVSGARIDPDVWRAACALDDYAPSSDLLEHLAARRLVTVVEGGWTLAHGMLGEALRRRASESDRLAAHHLACAAVTPASDPGRRGYHLLAGGLPEDAIGPLFEGASSKRSMASDYRGSLADLARVEEALDRLGDGGVRRGQMWDRQAMCLRALGRYAEARALSARGLDRLDQPGWEPIAAATHLTAAQIERDGGDLDRAHAHAADALAAATSHGDADLRATILMELGYIAWWRRDLDLADRWFESVRSQTKQTDLRSSDVAYAQALVAGTRRDPVASLARLEDAWAGYVAVGHRLGLARVLSVRAGIHHAQGEAELAIDEWQQALKLFCAVGSGDELICRLNLGSAYLDQDRPAAVLEVLEPMRWRFDDGRPFFAGALELVRASALARTGPRTAFRDALGRAELLLARAPRRDLETAGIAQRLAERVTDAEDAKVAWSLAADLWSRAGDSERAARARASA